MTSWEFLGRPAIESGRVHKGKNLAHQRYIEQHPICQQYTILPNKWGYFYALPLRIFLIVSVYGL